MSKGESSGGGVGFFGLLQVLFIGLKLTGHIDWSWFWVFAPMWGSIGLGLVVLVVFLVFHLMLK